MKIYENYLICPCEKVGKLLECSPDNAKLPYLSSVPTKTYRELKVGKEIPYVIDTRKVIVGESYPCFIRLRLDYKRKVDSHNFSKIFAFALHGEMAVNLENEGSNVQYPQNIDSIRDFLLNKF